jgi:hypothetical protein
MSKVTEGNTRQSLNKISKQVKELKHSVAKILELLRPPKKKTEKWMVDYDLESTTTSGD